MAGKFNLFSRVNLDEAPIGTEFQESDFASVTPDGNFVQLKYIEDEDRKVVKVCPGLYKVKDVNGHAKLEKTEFSAEKIIESYTQTEKIYSSISNFFNKLHVYYEELEACIPRRAALIFGPQGTGKSSGIKRACEKYLENKDTAVILWPTDEVSPIDFKDLLKTFNYVDGTQKLIVVAEDIGGKEKDEGMEESRSSLLSLLDNKEKTFTIPVFIAATTNYPETFLANLTNRPGRFDIQIPVNNPTTEEREQLLEFYLKDSCTEELKKEIRKQKYKDFSAAHIKEIKLRSRLNDITYQEAMDDLIKDIERFKHTFKAEGQKLGI